MTRITRTLMPSRRAALNVGAMAGLMALLLYAGRPAARQLVDAPVTCNICPAESTQTPYWKKVALTFAPGQVSVVSPLEQASPSGGRLVIEHVSAIIAVPNGQDTRINLNMTHQGTAMHSFLTLDPYRAPSGGGQFTASNPMRVQVPSTALLNVFASRSASSGSGEARVYIYGYTISVE